jgi:hypothetical protein
MNIKLLKKLKKNYSIIKYKAEIDLGFGSSEIKKGEYVYRLLYKGEKVNYAWDKNYRNIILALAYITKFKDSNFNFKYYTAENIVERGRKKQSIIKSKISLKKKILNAEKIWP